MILRQTFVLQFTLKCIVDQVLLNDRRYFQPVTGRDFPASLKNHPFFIYHTLQGIVSVSPSLI